MKSKSRPSNNFHCFEGNGRHLTREAARGMGLFEDSEQYLVDEHGKTQRILHGVKQNSTLEGYRTDYRKDPDGAALQTGGIYSPQEYKLSHNTYRRFISTDVHNQYGARTALYGNWWLEEDHYSKLVHYAKAQNKALYEVAREALYIPVEWGDCGYAVQARLTTPLKAWAGRGKNASNEISPNSQELKNTVVEYGIPGLSEHIRQLYIPFPYVRDASGKQVKSFFDVVRVINAKNDF